MFGEGDLIFKWERDGGAAVISRAS